MKPLSRKKRHGYFILCVLIFAVGAPFFILQAKGYRFNWSGVLKVSQTGGLYISTDQSGIAIYVNDALRSKTSIIQKSIFIQDLKPGTYEIRATKDGLQSWTKKLKVFPEIVTEARAFLIASNPELVEIPRFLDVERSPSASSSKIVASKNSEYDLINALFLPIAVKLIPAKSGTTSPDNKTLTDLFIKNDKGKLHVLWMGAEDAIPNYFCESVACKSEITVSAPSPILSYDFFPGRNDLLVLRLADGIFISEIDDRSPQNMEPIVLGLGYDLRIKDGKKIYIKKGEKIYSVSL